MNGKDSLEGNSFNLNSPEQTSLGNYSGLDYFGGIILNFPGGERPPLEKAGNPIRGEGIRGGG